MEITLVTIVVWGHHEPCVDIASKVDDYSICLQELAFILYELYCI